MKSTVSKERKRKTRQRHKLAGRDNHPEYRAQRPGVALMAALLTWVLTFVVLRIPGAQPGFIAGSDQTTVALLIDATLGAAALVMSAILLYILEPRLLRRNSSVILLCILVLLNALYSMASLQGTAFLPDPWNRLMPFVLPTVFAPLLGTLLLGARGGFACGLLTSLTMAIHTGHSLPVLVSGILAATLLAHLAPSIRTRPKAVKTALYAGLCQVPIHLLLALQYQPPSFRAELFSLQILTGIAAAVVAALLALMLLPLLEHVFNISTNISLLEFSDLGHPLLQRMALEAPGTYHHSLVVANIAQAAAEAIGANSLEARISAYFHDIGKLTKPEFFAENMFNRPNPHDQLTPTMSTLIITAHVKEGLSMAQLHKLPVCVHRAILEHHGSSVLQCFHHKAMTSQQEFELNDNTIRPLEESQFRYPGPRPSSRISAIICLADAVEAASRCITKPTPANLEDLVNEIVRKRLDDGQLDACELSLHELSRIKRAFVFTLANMLHGRVPYPQNHENPNPKSSEGEPGQPATPAPVAPADPAIRATA